MRIEPGSRSRCTERLNFRHPIRLNSFSSHYEPFRRAPLPLFTTANEDIISNRFSLSFSLLSSSHPLVSFHLPLIPPLLSPAITRNKVNGTREIISSEKKESASRSIDDARRKDSRPIRARSLPPTKSTVGPFAAPWNELDRNGLRDDTISRGRAPRDRHKRHRCGVVACLPFTHRILAAIKKEDCSRDLEENRSFIDFPLDSVGLSFHI